MCIKYFILYSRIDFRNLFVTGFFLVKQLKWNQESLFTPKGDFIPVISLEPIVECVVLVMPMIASSDPTSIS